LALILKILLIKVYRVRNWVKAEDFLPTAGGCSKNSHRHSEQSEESHIFLFKSKNQKRDPSDFIFFSIFNVIKMTKDMLA
jgi:hypothetical protein